MITHFCKLQHMYDFVVMKKMISQDTLHTSYSGASYKEYFEKKYHCLLTHWGRVTHIYVSKLTIIGSDNGLSPGRRQAIIWTNAGILLIRTLETNLSEILGEIHSFSFSKMHLKMSSAKWRLFGLGLNVLMWLYCTTFGGQTLSITLGVWSEYVGHKVLTSVPGIWVTINSFAKNGLKYEI